MDTPKKTFDSFCAPSQIYLVVSIIFFIISSIKLKPSLKYIGIHTLYIMFWTLLLNYICDLGYVKLSWFILFLPFILIGLTLFIGFVSGIKT
jgi:hypothetical protein